MFRGKSVTSSGALSGREAFDAVVSAALETRELDRAYGRRLLQIPDDPSENPVELVRALLEAAALASGERRLEIDWMGRAWTLAWRAGAEIEAVKRHSGWRLTISALSHSEESSRLLMKGVSKTVNVGWTAAGSDRVFRDGQAALQTAPVVPLDPVWDIPIGERDHLMAVSSKQQTLRRTLIGLAQALTRYDRAHFMALLEEFEGLGEDPEPEQIARAIWHIERRVRSVSPLQMCVRSRFIAIKWGGDRSPLYIELRRPIEPGNWTLFLSDPKLRFRSQDEHWEKSVEGDSEPLRRAQLDFVLDEWQVYMHRPSM